MADEITINSALNDKFFMEDIAKRKLFLNYDIDEQVFNSVGYWILRWNEEDKDIPVEKRKPIKLYVMSDGGDVISGLALIDIMLASETPIITVNFGQWYSMGFYIGICGDSRYGSRMSTYCAHDGELGIAQSTNKAKDFMNFYDELQKRMQKIICERTVISAEELEKNSRKEWHMFAEEARNKGVIDGIIGEDIDIAEVL